MKKKIQPINYGVTKTELNHQIVMMELMRKLIEETKETNGLLFGLLYGDKKNSPRLDPLNKQTATTQSFYKNQSMQHTFFRPSTEKAERQRLLGLGSSPEKHEQEEKTSPIKEEEEHPDHSENVSNQESEDSSIKKMIEIFQIEMKEMSSSNRQFFNKMIESSSRRRISSAKTSEDHSFKELIQILSHQHDPKKRYENYGVLSEIMPFSDKRQIKVRFNIDDLLEKEEKLKELSMPEMKLLIGEWIGMVFRAAASISWNMLLSNSLSFEEVKVLFTQNIIFNFIELFNELEKYFNEEQRLELTSHINDVAKQTLEFLCRQYPQTKIEAPNMALKKVIPLVQNHLQIKCDTIGMVLKEHYRQENFLKQVRFEYRKDKFYVFSIMKTINFMIKKTDEQFDQFQKIMSNIFENIYLPKEKRQLKKLFDIHQEADNTLTQYRDKVSSYSHYVIGRKIPKNTPQYNDLEIQHGVFFVKSPSILRIITKWVEELYQFVIDSQDLQKTAGIELKSHKGKSLTMSSRVKTLLFEKIKQKIPHIQSKIDNIRQQCFNIQSQLTSKRYTDDQNQSHLGDHQLEVGKFCSSLKNAISSYVCSQLSKLIYYLCLIPQEVDQKQLNIKDEDFLEQARKHLDSVNLVSLKIFDLLRCKCHSNEAQIIWIVEALKQLQKVDQKFEIVRVKDRLSKGTRDILINAQYDGGLVWQIQLAVTSNIDSKQDLLDKYNHFLYQLKRAKLGPLSQCVSIWSTLEQRSIYFEQMKKKKLQILSKQITHKGKNCSPQDKDNFKYFKRPIICFFCRQYFAVPHTALLNVRCCECKITYCGPCYYSALSQGDKKRFMFQNFDQNKLLTKSAFDELVEYTDYTKPLPKEGFCIKKYFLNRQLSYYTAVIVDDKENDEKVITIAQTVIKDDKKVTSRYLTTEETIIKVVDGEYYLQRNFETLDDFWIYYFPNNTTEKITLSELENELKNQDNFNKKYLNVLKQPNFMNESFMMKKYFEKMKLSNKLNEVQNYDDYLVGIHRFNNFNILAKFQFKDPLKLKQKLVQQYNKKMIKKFAKKKMTIVHIQSVDLSNEFDQLIRLQKYDFLDYLSNIQKLYVANNHICDLGFACKLTSLELLYITRNDLKSLKGIQKLQKLSYIKFDENHVTSLVELCDLINLRYVSGNYNEIQSLKGVEQLTNLRSISLCSNKINDISQLVNLSSLKKVYFRSNPLKDISIMSKLNLKHIFVGETLIEPQCIKEFQCIGSVYEISLKSLNLTSIPNIFETMTKLSELKLSGNKIKRIQNIQHLQNLKSLDLRQNQIQVMQNLESLNLLAELKLNGNKIKVVTCVRSFIDSLKLLSLQQNPLEDLSEYLIWEDKTDSSMRLKYTQKDISEKAANQIKAHSWEINNRSQADD